jgi:predicted Ser/Thr protein kinase
MTMSEMPPLANASREHRLEGVLAAYLHAAEMGKAPDRDKLIEQYPDLAADLESFFRNRDDMERIAAPIKRQLEAETIGPGESASAGIGGTIRYFGDYELQEELARGGMGVVYRARQTSLDREVALKMILAGQLASAEDVQRFQHEAAAAAKLDHPNIVPIYEIGEHQGQHYFSMKLVRGQSLARRVTDFIKDPRAAVQLMVKVARAVHAAHHRGVLHRDLKPGNILLDAAGEPYVADFGLAKQVDGRGLQTRTGSIMGTPSYMSPEQARAEKDLKPATDVYGLGAIFYELLTGRPPFRANNELDTLLQVLDSDPVAPRALNPHIPADLDAICLKCLDKTPTARYGSALALADDLQRWLDGLPIQARPSGSAKKALKWIRRKPTQTALVLVMACWLFNIRLPWNWSWLGWAFYGLAVGIGFWRLVIVCGRALGRWPDKKLWSEDAYFVPASVLALLALAFYPGSLADAKTASFAVLVVIVCCGAAILWVRRRKHAGPLLMVVRTPTPAMLVFLPLLAIILIANLGPLFDPDGDHEGDQLLNILTAAQSLSACVFCFMALCLLHEFRQRGLVTFFRSLPWNEIDTYQWQPTSRPEMVILRLNLHTRPLVFNMTVHPDKKDELEKVLAQHLRRAEPDAADLAMVPLQEIEPAARIKGPGYFLIVSGILQIVFAVFMIGAQARVMAVHPQDFEEKWGMSKSAAEWSNILLAIGGAMGIVYIAGGICMRRLKIYRFCRLCSILALVPLGAGIMLGLPGGIWGLQVLRRPDVQEAFATIGRRRR